MRHIVIDIETLGVTPGSAVLSFAAVILGGEDSLPYHAIIDPQSAVDWGLRIEPDTLRWWLKTNWRQLAGLLNSKDALSIEEGLDGLDEYLRVPRADDPDRCFWSKGAFDFILLGDVYRRLRRETPWRHDQCRDLRTLSRTLGQVWTKENTHDALDDAKNQAAQLEDLLRRIEQLPPIQLIEGADPPFAAHELDRLRQGLGRILDDIMEDRQKRAAGTAP